MALNFKCIVLQLQYFLWLTLLQRNFELKFLLCGLNSISPWGDEDPYSGNKQFQNEPRGIQKWANQATKTHQANDVCVTTRIRTKYRRIGGTSGRDTKYTASTFSHSVKCCCNFLIIFLGSKQWQDSPCNTNTQNNKASYSRSKKYVGKGNTLRP